MLYSLYEHKKIIEESIRDAKMDFPYLSEEKLDAYIKNKEQALRALNITINKVKKAITLTLDQK